MNLPISVHYKMDDVGSEPIAPQVSTSNKCNLGGVTLYFYANHFIIDPNTRLTGLKSLLHIDRETGTIQQLDRDEEIAAPEKKLNFTMFLGVLPVLDLRFLVFVEYVKQPILLEKHELYELAAIAYVPLGSQKQHERHQQRNQILGYLSYLNYTVMQAGYYFSFTYDLSVSKIKQAEGYPKNFKFCWNAHLAKGLYKLEEKGWMVSLIQGFINKFSQQLQGKTIDYLLISRRSWKKGGTRYNSRGIGPKGNVANFVQTQQIVYMDHFCCSHLQIRGSVPVFWRQTGIAATVEFTESQEKTQSAFRRHFLKMKQLYDRVVCINLLASNKPQEHQLTLYFEELIKQADMKTVRYEYFDFHEACKNQRFDNSNTLVWKLAPLNEYFKFYAEDTSENKVYLTQRGVMRTNCLDCLDRTNFIQTKLAVHILELMLTAMGINVEKRGLEYQSLVQALDRPDCTDPLVRNLKKIWADNGDAISVHYTGAGSTHTNIIRTGKRDIVGMVEHGLKSINRFYQHNYHDDYKQQVIDLLIGQHTETANLGEFESRMNSVAIRKDSLDG